MVSLTPPSPSLTAASVAATVRHVLSVGAGAAVTLGLTSQECVNSLVSGVDQAVTVGGGGLVGVAMLGWSFWQKYQASKA